MDFIKKTSPFFDAIQEQIRLLIIAHARQFHTTLPMLKLEAESWFSPPRLHCTSEPTSIAVTRPIDIESIIFDPNVCIELKESETSSHHKPLQGFSKIETPYIRGPRRNRRVYNEEKVRIEQYPNLDDLFKIKLTKFVDDYFHFKSHNLSVTAIYQVTVRNYCVSSSYTGWLSHSYPVSVQLIQYECKEENSLLSQLFEQNQNQKLLQERQMSKKRQRDNDSLIEKEEPEAKQSRR